MFDIHTHIIPGCDDGSESLEESILELRKIQHAGVTDVVLTPHYIRNIFDNTHDAINPIFEILKKEMIVNDLHLNIHQGAEVDQF